MRSFDRTMPEELNRVLTDHASDLLLCSTPTAVANLERESAAGRIELVGDAMADVTLRFTPLAEERSDALAELGADARATTCWSPRTGPATSTTRRGCCCSSSCSSGCRTPPSSRSTRARARDSWTPICWRASRRSSRCA